MRGYAARRRSAVSATGAHGVQRDDTEMMNSSRVEVLTTAPSFTGLSTRELRYLRYWQTAARAVGIDAVEDLSSRMWPCMVSGIVLGVYRTGETDASWLVIRHNAEWVVASCDDLTVSVTVASFEEALHLLHASDVGAEIGE